MRSKQALIRFIMAFICLCASGAAPALASGPAAAPQAALVVDTSSDGHDSALGDGVCWNGVDGCSLRAAIEQAFTLTKPVTITFNSTLAGTTLTLMNGLGTLLWSGSQVTLDGGDYQITVDGGSLPAGAAILRIQGDDNILNHLSLKNSKGDGLQVGDFAGVGAGNRNQIINVNVYGSSGAGIFVRGGQANRLAGDTLGASGWLAAACNPAERNLLDGVYVAGAAANTRIESNHIVCNNGNGIYLDGSALAGGPVVNTEVSNNALGAIYDTGMGNSQNGLRASDTTGTAVGANIISGNGSSGIWFEHSSDSSILNNIIGANGAMTAELPNLADGIILSDDSSRNQIGNAFNTNVISGNRVCGVIVRTGSNDNTFDNNRIGLDGAAAASIPNGLCGVSLSGVSGTIFSPSPTSPAQYISGNLGEGIAIESSSAITIGARTAIGLGSDGVTLLGNGLEGVLITASTGVSVQAGAIAGNGAASGGAGVAVTGFTATGNRFDVGRVYANKGIPFDLGNDGFSPNGMNLPPGPNNWMRYPVVTGSDWHSAHGTACAGCRVIPYLLLADPTLAGGGGVRLAGREVLADAGGNWSLVLPATLGSGDVALVACDPASGDCSEMSPAAGPPYAAVLLPFMVKGH